VLRADDVTRCPLRFTSVPPAVGDAFAALLAELDI
jgi:hypothetical protein